MIDNNNQSAVPSPLYGEEDSARGFSKGCIRLAWISLKLEIICCSGHHQFYLQGTFQPEFLNRLDDIVVFNSLDGSSAQQLAALLINQTSSRLEEAQGCSLQLSGSLLQRLVKLGISKVHHLVPLLSWEQPSYCSLLSVTTSARNTQSLVNIAIMQSEALQACVHETEACNQASPQKDKAWWGVG